MDIISQSPTTNDLLKHLRSSPRHPFLLDSWSCHYLLVLCPCGSVTLSHLSARDLNFRDTLSIRRASLPSTCLPCTMLCLKICATPSACPIPLTASSEPASNDLELLNPSRAWDRAAWRRAISPESLCVNACMGFRKRSYLQMRSLLRAGGVYMLREPSFARVLLVFLWYYWLGAAALGLHLWIPSITVFV